MVNAFHGLRERLEDFIDTRLERSIPSNFMTSTLLTFILRFSIASYHPRMVNLVEMLFNVNTISLHKKSQAIRDPHPEKISQKKKLTRRNNVKVNLLTASTTIAPLKTKKNTS